MMILYIINLTSVFGIGLRSKQGALENGNQPSILLDNTAATSFWWLKEDTEPEADAEDDAEDDAPNESMDMYSFHWFSTNKNQADAQNDCIRRGGSLTSILDQEENELLTSHVDGEYWIGLNDIKEENTWIWEDGQPFEFSNWDNGEPNDYGSGEDCVTLNDKNGEWNDLDCDAERPYICKYKSLEAAATGRELYCDDCKAGGDGKYTVWYSPKTRYDA